MNIHKITRDYLSILAVRQENKRNLAAAYICGGLPFMATYLCENIFVPECGIDGNEKCGHLPILTAYFNEIYYDNGFNNSLFDDMAVNLKEGLINTENDIDLFSRETVDKLQKTTTELVYPVAKLIQDIPVGLLTPDFILAAKRSEDTGWMIENVIGGALRDSVLSPADVVRYALVGQCLI